MAENIPKRKIRDSVFTNLFQEKKYLLQLYKALHPEDADVTEDEIADVTIKHVLVDADYNDLGFSVGDRLLVLVESQSTWTMNIIIRALMYLMQTYHDYFKRTNQNLYGSKKVKMPKPELYMIFTGDRKAVPGTISLSKEFFSGAGTAVDAEIRVLYQENEDDIIGQYIIFCKVYQEQRKRYGNTIETVTETIRICKDRNVLKEYLESREKEIVDMMMTLFDDEQIYKAVANDIRQETTKEVTRKVTREVTREVTRKVTRDKAILMIQKGKIAMEEITEYFPELSEEDRKEIESRILQ